MFEDLLGITNQLTTSYTDLLLSCEINDVWQLVFANMLESSTALSMVNKYIVAGLENTILSIVMSPTNMEWVGEYQ